VPYILPRVKAGVSACLLGQPVRFDGGHKCDDFLIGSLVDFLDLVPVCPEVGSGMGILRPPIRLVGNPERPRAIGADDAALDITEHPFLHPARLHTMEAKPLLPVVEETWLKDPVLREDFLTRVLAYHRLNFSGCPGDGLSADGSSAHSSGMAEEPAQEALYTGTRNSPWSGSLTLSEVRYQLFFAP